MQRMKITTQKVERCFTNAFAQDVYYLEDGTRIYISYSNDFVTIEKPIKDKE